MRPGRGAVIIMIGLALGLPLGGLAVWAMFGDDGAASRPVVAAETVAPVEVAEPVPPAHANAVEAAVRLFEQTAPTSPNWRAAIGADVVGDADDVAAMIETNELAAELLEESPTLAEAGRTKQSGHRIVSYSDLDATVELFRTDATGRTVAVPVRVVWREERWRMVAPKGGTLWGQVREVTQ